MPREGRRRQPRRFEHMAARPCRERAPPRGQARRREVQVALEGNTNVQLPVAFPQACHDPSRDAVSIETQTDNEQGQQTGNFLHGHVIWIVGSSIPYWVKRRAIKRSSINLGLEKKKCTVKWHTKGGMTWHEVFPKISWMLAKSRYLPDMIVVHCGGNSLIKVKKGVLANNIKNDLLNISLLAGPTTTVVWSSILPRLNWHSDRQLSVVEKARKCVNRSVSCSVLARGGRWLKHAEITADTPGLFRNDGVHLSPIGLDIFISSLQELIESLASNNSNKAVFD
ncbi:uncharacterized protein LOC132718920 [Ruditapes philippinarum]|uniref:uncharacterized protein LOC132718920 n=1 Tax=Ruditapes philippinarum TaxID=129788 RepID=UPI00295B9D25|nr:uncharacterized protein LOC132718920 [Ruditapes philippinarum]